MSSYMILLIVLGVIAAIVIIAVLSSIGARKSTYYRLKACFGQINRHEFSYEEYESVSHYFKNTLGEDETCIDDITWNDLDMDRIFLMINNSHSSIGRDYLYRMLRIPSADKSVLEERERLAEYFEKHPEERTRIMQYYDNVGFTGKMSITDHVEQLLSLKPSGNTVHYTAFLCIIASLIFTLFAEPVIGTLMLLVSCGYSIVTYYKIKSRTDSFFACVKQIVSMTDAAKGICRLNIPELEEYNKQLDKNIKSFRKISSNSWLLVSGKTSGGNISDIIMEYVRMFTHIDLIKFNSVLKHISEKRDEIYSLIETLGIIESMISVASFRHLLPYFVQPEFTVEDVMEIHDIYHLSIKAPVANSIKTARPVLITGSNASGKSTFLKSVAIGAILAQTINTCPCEYYKAPFFRIYSSMALTDHLETGESYYIVEIKSLKRIVDAAHTGGCRIICFIDEVLRGTNTVERIAASTEILKNLADSGVLCFAATHDTELTHLLDGQYDNYHFSEQVKDGEIVFSYVIQNGRATSRNAIRLLEIIGYDKDIINNATTRADSFIREGIWR